jgi:hypothetical protein
VEPILTRLDYFATKQCDSRTRGQTRYSTNSTIRQVNPALIETVVKRTGLRFLTLRRHPGAV